MGLRKRIGNGKSMHFFTDPWIPKVSTFKPIVLLGIAYQEMATVADFITPTMGWDLHKIKEVIMQDDVHIIETIPISVSND